MVTSVRNISAVEIIDGQQRLLTLQTLLIAFRDQANKLDDEWLNAELRLLTSNPGVLVDENERYKVWPINAYHDDLKNIYNAGTPEALQELYPQRRYYGKMIPERPKLVEAYLFFSEKIRDFLSIDEDDLEKESVQPHQIDQSNNATILYETLKDYIQLVEITLEEEDDPQVIFETLNYRGVPLDPSDLIRNFIFLDIFRNKKSIETLYKEYWAIFDEQVNGQKFWKVPQKQGRLKRSRLDLFFFHYTVLRTMKDVRITHLYQEYKDWWETNTNNSIEKELLKINKLSKVFKQLLEPTTDQQLSITAERLQILDITTAHPLILWLFENHERFQTKELEGILQDIESYLIRRLVCRLTTKGYNRTFLDLLKKVSKEEKPSRAFIQRELLSSKADTFRWPDDDEFQRHFVYEPMYSFLLPKRTRMILSAIEIASRTKYQEMEYAPLPKQGSLTIEHILPQNYKYTDWPLRQQYSSEEEKSQIINEREKALHSIGNLTLLTQPLNTEVSNGPFSKKRSEITKSLLVLNSYFQKYTDQDTWLEDQIFERGHILAKQAINIWSFPKITL
jgi:uncharacterized protein with ParB-like and HNH nuclease domain